MKTSARSIALSGAILSLSAVVLAALGAHAVDMKGLLTIWQNALLIHMFNGAGIIGISALLGMRESVILMWGAWLITIGTVLFSGSIYVHVMTQHVVSGIAPMGGLLMMTGWSLAVLAFLRR